MRQIRRHASVVHKVDRGLKPASQKAAQTAGFRVRIRVRGCSVMCVPKYDARQVGTAAAVLLFRPQFKRGDSMKTPVIVILLSALLVGGCSTTGGDKQTVGGLTGAALGGLLGSQFGSGTGRLAATGALVFLGALVGSEIGRSMDEVDKMLANEAVLKARTASIGETITWNNSKSGYSGTVTAVRDGVSGGGDYCREFQQTVTIGGQSEEAYGIACRQPDGDWRILQ